jgi:hypothetical protein
MEPGCRDGIDRKRFAGHGTKEAVEIRPNSASRLCLSRSSLRAARVKAVWRRDSMPRSASRWSTLESA